MLVMHTIGHSTRDFDDVVSMLRNNTVTQLVDVRSFPSSRTSRNGIAKTFRARSRPTSATSGFEQLGGRRYTAAGVPSPNGAWRVKAFRDYADYMSTGAFQTGLDELVRLDGRLFGSNHVQRSSPVAMPSAIDHAMPCWFAVSPCTTSCRLTRSRSPLNSRRSLTWRTDASPTRHGGRHMNYLDEVRRIVNTVPPGQVITYGEIAALMGISPRRAGRLVGQLGDSSPWWRVVYRMGPRRPATTAPRPSLLAQKGHRCVDDRVDIGRTRTQRPGPDRSHSFGVTWSTTSSTRPCGNRACSPSIRRVRPRASLSSDKHRVGARKQAVFRGTTPAEQHS